MMPMRRLIWKLPLLGLLIAAVVAAVVGGWAVWQVRGTPAYWQVRPADDPDAEAGAERFEFRLQAEMSRLRAADEPWRMRVEAAEINDWLATRLPQWEAHEAEAALPDWIAHPMIVAEPGRLVAAAELRFKGRGKVVSFAYRPTHEPDGVAALKLSKIRVGKLWMPPGEGMRKLIAEVGGLSAEAEARLDEVFEQFRRIRLERALEDGRVVRIRDLDVRADQLIARCRTVNIPHEAR